MAKRLTIPEQDGEYALKVQVGSVVFDAILDTGFTHPRCETGLCVETAVYEQIVSLLADQQAVQAFAVGGRPYLMRSGRAKASIVGLDEAAVETRILDGGSNLVGVCFLRKLPRYRLTWDLAVGRMRIWTR